MNHDVQWKDPTGDLQQLLVDHLASSNADLVAEEACGLPTTVAQRLSCKLNKPWIDIDLSIAERKLAGIYDKLIQRRSEPIDPFANVGSMSLYLPEEDGFREAEWVRRILRTQVQVVICLCGFLHVDPVTRKLEENGCVVEDLKVSESEWFRNRYGTYTIVENDGKRWCETRLK